MSRCLYFAYGSNLDAEQMADRCPSAMPRFAAELDDHRLAFSHFSRRWNGGAADVVPEPGARVWGIVYEMAALELSTLDVFEAGYDRCRLRVRANDGLCHDVISYTVTKKSRGLRPTAVYRDKILRWGAHWEFPDSYLASIREFAIHTGSESAGGDGGPESV